MGYKPALLTRAGAALVAMTAVVGLMAGCSSDSKSSSKDSATQTSENDLRNAAMRAYWATMKGDYETAWNLVSPRCRAKLVNNSYSAFAGQLKQAYATRAPALVNAGDPKLTVTVDGDTGKVTTNAPDGKSSKEPATWVKINGQWVSDNC